MGRVFVMPLTECTWKLAYMWSVLPSWNIAYLEYLEFTFETGREKSAKRKGYGVNWEKKKKKKN